MKEKIIEIINSSKTSETKAMMIIIEIDNYLLDKLAATETNDVSKFMPEILIKF